MRVRAGFSANEVGDKLNWSRGRLQRMEGNQWRLPEASFVRDLARIYGAGDADEAELLDLDGARAGQAVVARVRGRLREGRRVPRLRERRGPDRDLHAPRPAGPAADPPVHRGPHAGRLKPPDWRARALEARLRRQQILDRPRAAPWLTAVITEASLAYRWGTPAERRDQLAHLIAVSRRPNVELRLLRFEDGPHPGMSSLINIFDFPDDQDPSIVYLEIDTALQEVTSADEVRAYKEVFSRICTAALGQSATRSHLERLADAER